VPRGADPLSPTWPRSPAPRREPPSAVHELRRIQTQLQRPPERRRISIPTGWPGGSGFECRADQTLPSAFAGAKMRAEADGADPGGAGRCYIPEMPVRVEEASLSMRTPRRFMVSYWIVAIHPGSRGTAGERVGVVRVDLDPYRRGAQLNRALPAVAFRLGQKERRPPTSKPITEPRFHSSEAPRAR
jgi:hypothetical protein